jgi:transposase-like protein
MIFKNTGKSEDRDDTLDDLGDDPKDYLIYYTNNDGRIPIYKFEDLMRVGTGDKYPEGVIWSLNGKYDLKNDIDCTSSIGNGVKLGLTVPFSKGTQNGTAKADIILSAMASEMYVWIDDIMQRGTNTDRVSIDNIPFGEYTLILGGKLVTGESFAYSVDIFSFDAGTFNTTFETSVFTPIGMKITNQTTGAFTVSPFTGEFNGEGKNIIGLNYASYSNTPNTATSGTVYGGLFAQLGNNAKITGLGLLCNNFTVITAYGTATVYVGGIAGHIIGNVTIEKCFVIGPVVAASVPTGTGNTSGTTYAGSIVGYASGTTKLFQCRNAGPVTAVVTGQNAMFTGKLYVGGILGGANGKTTIEECANIGRVVGKMVADKLNTSSELYVGGILGGNGTGLSSDQTLIYNSYNTATIIASAVKLGGGGNNPVISVGGIAGRMRNGTTAAVNCYSIFNENDTSKMTVTSSWTANVGGILGTGDSTYLVNTYFLENLGGVHKLFVNGKYIAGLYGSGTVNNPGSASGPKSDTEMMDIATYNTSGTNIPGLSGLFNGGTVPGWDIANDDKKLWTMRPDLVFDGYPKITAFTGDASITLAVTLRSEAGFTLTPLKQFGYMKIDDRYITYFVPLGMSFPFTLTVNPDYSDFINPGLGDIALHTGELVIDLTAKNFVLQKSDIYKKDSYVYTYSLQKVKRSCTVFVTGIGHNVTIDPQSRGVFEVDFDRSVVPLRNHADFEFDIMINSRYKPETLTVSVNGTDITDQNVTDNSVFRYKYNIKDVTESIVIKITVDKEAYDVDFYQGPGTYCTLPEDTSAKPGSTHDFTITLDGSYIGYAPSVSIVGLGNVQRTGGTAGDAQFTYRISDIYSDIEVHITVEYTVTVIGDNISPSGALPPVNDRDSLYFVFMPDRCYKLPDTVTVTMGGIPVSTYFYDSSDGSFAIDEVNDNVVITITAIQYLFDVTLPSPQTGYTLTTEGPTEVESGGSFTFMFSLDAAYSASSPVIKVNGTPVTVIDGEYTITNITENKVITVEEVIINTYSVSLTTGTGYVIGAKSGSSSPVDYDGSFTFTFLLDTPYSASLATVKVNGTEVDVSGGEYTITNITEDIVVTVEDVVINTYTVSLTTGTGYVIGAKPGSVSPVNYDGSFTFTFSLGAAYSASSPVIKVNGTKVDMIGGEYTITNITENKVITVEGVVINTYSVSLTGGTGYVIDAKSGSSSPVNYGGSFTFMFSLETPYSASLAIVKVNGTEVDVSGGEYTITNITENKVITVEGIVINTYSVSLTDGTGYVIGAKPGFASPVNYGGSFTFTFSLETPYSASLAIVKVNGAEVDVSSGEYTILNITEDIVVTVEDVVINTYAVSLTTGTGYVIDAKSGSSSPVDYGGSFTFTFSLDTAYSASSPVVKVNGVTVDASSGEYTITNITKEVTVTVEDVMINTYTVSLTTGTGYVIDAKSGSSSPVDYGGSFTFTFSLNTPYSASLAIVKVNGTEVDVSGGEYTITNITEDIVVTVEDVVINTYTVTLSEGTGYTMEAKSGSSLPVQYDGSYTFTFFLDVAYSASSPVIKVNGTEVDVSSGEYTISGIRENTTVSVEGVLINTYAVMLQSGTGYTLKAKDGSSSPVDHGDPFTFTFSLDAAYSAASPMIKVNGMEVDVSSGEYTILNITETMTITVDGVVINTYTVSLTDGTGYVIGAKPGSASPVNYGGSFTFTFSLETAYSASSPVIKVNGTKVDMIGGEYTIPNITENTTVTVEEVVINTYTVSLTGGMGYVMTTADPTTVEYGDKFTFTFSLETAYSASPAVVKVNGIAVTVIDGEYTILNITEDVIVTVEGVVINTYTVSLTGGTGYVIDVKSGSSSPVDYGGSFTFTFSLDTPYSASLAIVKVNGTEVDVSSGEYTITNITEDTTVTVEGVVINTYTVSLTGGMGYVIDAKSGSSSPVNYGGSFTFTFSLDVAYSASSPVVKVNGVTVDASSGEYTITNITEDTTVTVEGVVINTYTVSLTGGTGYVIDVKSGSSSPVDYGSSFTFTFSLDTPYSASLAIVKVNGTEVDVSSGEYTILNITEDIVVTVEDVVINTYTVSLTGGTGYALNAKEGSSPVEYGSSFTFTFSLDTAYSASSPAVKVNGVTVDASSGEYTILNITEDMTVTVEDVTMNTYPVTLSHSGTGGTLTYTVTYDGIVIFSGTLDSATSSVTLTVQYGANLEILAGPSNGYRFDGWDDGRPVKMTDDTYAADIYDAVDVTGGFSPTKRSLFEALMESSGFLLILIIILFSIIGIAMLVKRREEKKE